MMTLATGRLVLWSIEGAVIANAIYDAVGARQIWPGRQEALVSDGVHLAGVNA
jgi:hypothetical protein